MFGSRDGGERFESREESHAHISDLREAASGEKLTPAYMPRRVTVYVSHSELPYVGLVSFGAPQIRRT